MLRGTCLALVVMVSVPCAAAPIPCIDAGETGRVLAHPTVVGSVGPFRRVGVVLTRSAAVDRGAFDVRLKLPDGRCMTLAGPEDPNAVFLIDVTAIRFVPQARGSVLVILFNSSQIGPMNGTERQALAFRLSAAPAGRAQSRRFAFDDVPGVAAVMRKLARVR